MNKRLQSHKRRRVLLVSNTSWYLWNFRSSLAKALQAQGYQVVFAAPPDDYSGRLETIGAEFVPLAMDRKGRNPAGELLLLVRIVLLVRRVQADAVLTWTPKPNIYGAVAGRVLGVPIIPNIAGLGFAFIGGGWTARVSGWLYRIALRRWKIVFFQNAEDRTHFVDAGWVHPNAARDLPGSGVDLERFAFQPMTDSSEFCFLFAGRLLADKGLRELAEVVRVLRDQGLSFVVRVAGFLDPGNPAAIERDELDGWVREGLFDYLGSSDRVATLIAEADCVVLPSYREGRPRILLEAAAVGRPVVTTDVPGCREAVLPERTGLLCQARDAGSLAAAMRRILMLSAAEREAMGRQARAFAEERLDERIVLRSYLQALREVLT